jgi:hypothetical protein
MEADGLTLGDDSTLFRVKAMLLDCQAREQDLLVLVAQQRQEISRLQELTASLQLEQAMARLASGFQVSRSLSGCPRCGDDGTASTDSGVSNGPEATELEAEGLAIGFKRLRVE